MLIQKEQQVHQKVIVIATTITLINANAVTLMNANAHKCFILVTRGAEDASRPRGARNPRGARGAERGLRRSKRVEERYRDKEEETEEEEEEVLLSSQQSSTPSSTTPQSTQSSFTSFQPARSLPIIINSPDNQDVIIRRSRSTTPILPLAEADADTISPAMPTTPIVTTPVTSTPPSSSNIEYLLVKQGKQIFALYEMQKKMMEKIDNVQEQLKKIVHNKTTDLSPKIFNVSNNLVLITLYIIDI